MSYKYGLNGNDIEWGNTDFMDMHCSDCADAFAELIAQNPTMSHEDAWDKIECSGHTIEYREKGKGIFYHDTNSNFVAFRFDRVKVDLLVTDYLVDWLKSGDATKYRVQQIRKELKWRYQNQHFTRHGEQQLIREALGKQR